MALVQARADFHSDHLTFDLAQIFTKNRSKSAKSNTIFHLKGRAATELGLTDLGSPMAESFFYMDLFSVISAIFRG